MLSRPMDMRVFAESKEKVELFGEEIVVVLELEAEERKGFDEGAAARNDFCAATGDQIQRGELLKDTDRVCGAEDGNCAGEANLRCARGCSGENDCGGGVEVLAAMVFAETEDIEADLVCRGNLIEQLRDSFLGGYRRAGHWVRN